MPVRPALAGDRVRHTGEAVAMVIGETFAAAQDGAEAVEVEYAPLDPVTDLREAVKPGAPQVWPEAPGNIAVDWAGLAANPDEMAAKVDAAMKSAAHVARISLVHQRINVASMEPRGGTASYDAANDSYLLRVCSQGARAMRDSMAGVMGIPPAKIRVTTEEVGGAFGLKTGPYPEYIAMLVGAKKIGRPVFWMSGRNESFVSDNHARDAYSDVELALDDKGKFLALRIRHLGSMGAYIGAVGANIQTANMMRCLPGMYDIKLIDAQTKCVFTNTTPTAPYRGAGRPEASYCLERVVDEAARVTGIDPIRLRRKNLISQKAMPYKTAIGTTYDSGDFATVVDKGLALADYEGFKARKKESKKKGLLRGLGICFVLEHAGGSPVEGTKVSFPGGDNLMFTMNVQSTGQGHATIFPRLVAERLGIKAEQVGHAHGDSAHEIAGYASVGSRTAMTAGHAMVKTLEAMLAKGKKVAATALEAGEGDIEYKNGAFNVVGTDRRMSLFDVAARAKEMKKKGEIAEDLDTKVVTETPLTFPNGCHIAEVEVDPQTGLSTLAVLFGDGRQRQHPRPHHRGGPGARLGRHGRRPGDAGADRVRRRRPARQRLVHGLRHAARAPPADVQGRRPRGAGDDQPARRQGRGRGRHHGGDRGGDERVRRCHSGRGAQDPDAGDAGEGVEGVPGDGGLSRTRNALAVGSPGGGEPANPRIQVLRSGCYRFRVAACRRASGIDGTCRAAATSAPAGCRRPWSSGPT